jgi:mono/diheme cytochrome c family protein
MRNRQVLAVVCVLSFGTVGCEQISANWFPQMKKQPAIQAFESTEVRQFQNDATVRLDHSGFMPPLGAVAIGQEAAITRLEGETLVNPVPEIERGSYFETGKLQFETFCATCHGMTGLGDGPVAPVFVGVMALTGPTGVAKYFTDGHIYTTMRNGGVRMPSYNRIPAEDRWAIVTYIRYLDAKSQGGQR